MVGLARLPWLLPWLPWRVHLLKHGTYIFLVLIIAWMDPYRFKVVVVGDAFAGKSCLLHRLRFSAMPRGRYINTIGCEFFSYLCKTEAGSAHLCMWDTAGHETFRAFTPSFLRNAHACLLCVDLSEASAVANLQWWAEEARRHTVDVSLIVVGTKADLHPAISKDEFRHLAGSMAALFHRETSAMTGEGVETLFHDVAIHLLAKHPHRPPQNRAVSLGAGGERGEGGTGGEGGGRGSARGDACLCTC